MDAQIAAFASGIVGALAREAFRWRGLYLANRLKRYCSSMYVSIATVIVLLGGAAAVILSNLAPTEDMRLPVAFVIGAGFDLAVKLASKLRMPNVVMGNKNDEKQAASLDEFLRY